MKMYTVPEHVFVSKVQEEIILLDSRSDEYKGLNKTGGVIWELLLETGSVETTAHGLSERFDVSAEDALVHCQKLLDELLAAGLLNQSDQ